MSTLEAFQTAFGAALRASRGEPKDAALARALVVHRNSAAKAASDALAANYPVVRALVGEDSFAACAQAFAQAHPPAEARLCLYGQAFAAFLVTYPPFATLGYLSDVARLERLYTEALFAADAPTADGADFAAGLDLDAAIALHPACRFARLGSPAVGVWLAHQTETPDQALGDLAWREEIALVTRPDDQVRVTAIGEGAARFLAACQARLSLGEAALSAAESGEPLGPTFTTLIDAGAFLAPTAS